MTIRSHIYTVNFFLFFLVACAGHAPVSKLSEARDNAAKVDKNKDGRTDLWQFFEKDPQNPERELLVREELDLNSDGKVDMRKEFINERLAKIQMDFDFDAKFDQTEMYQNGVLSRVELSHAPSEKVDTWRFYEEGKLQRIEKDTNSDGHPDQWLYYEGENLARVGRDFNFDGVVDRWEQKLPKNNQKN